MTSCCGTDADCSRSGDFRSITQHFRSRRSVDQSSLAAEHRTPDEVIAKEKLTSEKMSSDEPDVTSSHHQLQSTSLSSAFLSEKMLDVVDARIEGMEEVIEDLKATLLDMSNKVIRKCT